MNKNNSKEVWITTTCGPDGFDIFTFTAWLHKATLTDLYVELACLDDLITLHEHLYEASTGDVQEEMGQMMQFFNNLHHEVGMAIFDRITPAVDSIREN